MELFCEIVVYLTIAINVIAGILVAASKDDPAEAVGKAVGTVLYNFLVIVTLYGAGTFN
jgi:hypothetical protein